MPQAVTHILVPLVLADLYRDYIAKKKFNLRYVLIAGLAGLLPDIDIALAWLLRLFSSINISDLHRTFTHSIWFPLLFLILFSITKNYNPKFFKKSKLKLHLVFLAIAFGTFVHLLLDAFLTNSLYILYPFSNYLFGLNLNLQYFQGTFFAGLDAILLVIWLIHEELNHKISDYI